MNFYSDHLSNPEKLLLELISENILDGLNLFSSEIGRGDICWQVEPVIWQEIDKNHFNSEGKVELFPIRINVELNRKVLILEYYYSKSKTGKKRLTLTGLESWDNEELISDVLSNVLDNLDWFYNTEKEKSKRN